MKKLKIIGITIGLLVFLYLIILGLGWKLQNPGASDLAFLFHLNDAIHFRQLPEYQLK
jgi:hypothetical protein